MKVRELIALLQTFDSELDVMYVDDVGWIDISKAIVETWWNSKTNEELPCLLLDGQVRKE